MLAVPRGRLSPLPSALHSLDHLHHVLGLGLAARSLQVLGRRAEVLQTGIAVAACLRTTGTVAPLRIQLGPQCLGLLLQSLDFIGLALLGCLFDLFMERRICW